MKNIEICKSEKFAKDIVRCVNCKWNTGSKLFPYCQQLQKSRRHDWFCADGEERDSE